MQYNNKEARGGAAVISCLIGLIAAIVTAQVGGVVGLVNSVWVFPAVSLAYAITGKVLGPFLKFLYDWSLLDRENTKQEALSPSFIAANEIKEIWWGMAWPFLLLFLFPVLVLGLVRRLF